MGTLKVSLAKPVANDIFGTRLCAKYYSEKLEDGGRVWIGQGFDLSYGYTLNIIENKQLGEIYCGRTRTNTI